MRGRLNYIELRVVTQRIYKRIGEGGTGGRVNKGYGGRRGRACVRRSGIYSTTFWLRLILKNRHRQKLRAHPRAYILARARRPYLFVPRVLRFVLRLSLALTFHPFVLALATPRIRLPPVFRRNMRLEETTPYNIRATFIVMHSEITN